MVLWVEGGSCWEGPAGVAGVECSSMEIQRMTEWSVEISGCEMVTASLVGHTPWDVHRRKPGGRWDKRMTHANAALGIIWVNMGQGEGRRTYNRSDGALLTRPTAATYGHAACVPELVHPTNLRRHDATGRWTRRGRDPSRPQREADALSVDDTEDHK